VLRTFIAIELEQAVTDALAQVQADLRRATPSRSVRWVRPESIHLTLKFLGETPAARLMEIKKALVAAAAEVPPCSIAVQGLDCFPNPRRPRVLWVGVSEPTGKLRALWQAIEAHVAPLGWPTESRGFQPHLTLGRVQRRSTPAQRRSIGEVVERSNVGWLGSMNVSEVSFISSKLKPSGAKYSTLKVAELREHR
jgi:2'-5' RNA ligase